MSDGSAKRSKKRKKEPIKESVLRGFKYFKVLAPILEGLRSDKDHHNRKLFFDEYLALLLLT